MFEDANSFRQILYGAAWVHSKASKRNMFVGSHGSISLIVLSATSEFLPRSKLDLKRAVGACLRLSPEGDFSSTVLVE